MQHIRMVKVERLEQTSINNKVIILYIIKNTSVTLLLSWLKLNATDFETFFLAVSTIPIVRRLFQKQRTHSYYYCCIKKSKHTAIIIVVLKRANTQLLLLLY